MNKTELIKSGICTPAAFAYYQSGKKWMPYKHLSKIDEKLVQIATGGLKRLMILMPPQHGKSTFLSQYFPAWYLSMFPDERLILGSYNQEIANHHSSKAREILVRNNPSESFIQNELKSFWRNRHDGSLNSVGMSNSPCCHGVAGIIVDDPMADRHRSLSKIHRDMIWEWYQIGLGLMLLDKGWIILIMTRWHEDDLAGRILESIKSGKEEEHWEILKFPALAEENDVLSREINTPLCPELYGYNVLKRKKEEVGGSESFVWSSLYQQEPFGKMVAESK